MRSIFMFLAFWGIVGSASLLGSGPSLAQTAAPLDVSGKYEVVGKILGVTVTFVQKGTAVTGTYEGEGTITGKMATPTRLEGRFSDQRGTGWFTANFTPDGSTFSGPWGWAGKPPIGHINGKRVKATS